MPSLRDIKRRIKSVKNTRQITKAMKMVSAAKLKKAQDDIVAARPYADKMTEFVASLAAKTAAESHPLLGGPRSGEGEGGELPEITAEGGAGARRIGVVLITSDRGLCGSFNAVLLRTMESFLRENEDSKISLYLIGKRAIEHFKRRDFAIISQRPAGSGRPNYATAKTTAAELIERFVKAEFDEVHVIYSEFKSALSQRPVTRKLLPISAPAKEEGEEGEGGEAEIDVIYEPSAGAVLADLLPKYVEVQVFRSLLESAASEHGARMTAMDSASKNASEMIDLLTLKYNRLRQAAITKELMEIIGGAEALKG